MGEDGTWESGKQSETACLGVGKKVVVDDGGVGVGVDDDDVLDFTDDHDTNKKEEEGRNIANCLKTLTSSAL